MLEFYPVRDLSDMSGVPRAVLHEFVERESVPQEKNLARLEAYARSQTTKAEWAEMQRAHEEETPEQAVSATMPDVSFLKPRARAIYDRAVGSYLTRGWPQPIIERAAWDLVNYIIGANTLRSSGAGRPELTEDEQVMVLERTREHVERAYGPNGALRRS
jgi:hypothetical protein